MRLVSLLLLLLCTKTSATESNGCIGHKSANRGKFCDKSVGGGHFWLEQYRNGNLGGVGDVQILEIVCELSEKQLMLEAIFGKVSEDYINLNGNISKNQFKLFKDRQTFISRNDPALSQLLEALFDVQMSAKKTIQSADNIDKLILMVNTLKQRLTYALTFVANRLQIQLDKPRENFVLTQKDQKLFWNDLINFFNETKKCGPNFKEEDNDDGRKYTRKRKQFLQFVANSLEINWDGSASLNRQKSGSNRRRKRRRNVLNSDTANATNSMAMALAILCSVVLLVVIYYNVYMCCLRAGPNAGAGAPNRTELERVEQVERGTLADDTTPQMDSSKYSNVFKEIPLTFVDEKQEAKECAICLSPIGFKSKVRPLPACNHIFHNECVEQWLQNGHNTCPMCRQSLPETSTAAQTLNDHLLLMRQQNIASSSASMNSAALSDAVGADQNIETAQGTEADQ
uniref:RING-type domain-containing protein n=1 Tax=Globodera pallida TaxID=36090 RepID=A0A183C1Q0_GLOPA